MYFVHVGLSVIEFIKLVVIDLTRHKAGGVFAVDLCYLLTHNSNGIRGSQLKSTLEVGVASVHFEGDEVQSLTDSLGRDGKEERHHRVKRNRDTITVIALHSTFELTME